MNRASTSCWTQRGFVVVAKMGASNAGSGFNPIDSLPSRVAQAALDALEGNGRGVRAMGASVLWPTSASP